MIKTNQMIYILLIGAISSYIALQIIHRSTSQELPLFIREDKIIQDHETHIDIEIISKYKPDSFQLIDLKLDYKNLWAHFNHIYETNDILAGKEYYTEAWMRQLTRNDEGNIEATGIKRRDIKHSLIIHNWSADGLVCTAIDSNVELVYTYPDGITQVKQAKIALILLYQGDHWRVDAMRVINEFPIVSYRNIIPTKSLMEILFP